MNMTSNGVDQNMETNNGHHDYCKTCGMCGHYRGYGHYWLRWLLGLVILAVVFCLGVAIGSLKAEFRHNRFNGGGYMMYGNPDNMMFRQGLPLMMQPTATTTPVK